MLPQIDLKRLKVAKSQSVRTAGALLSEMKQKNDATTATSTAAKMRHATMEWLDRQTVDDALSGRSKRSIEAHERAMAAAKLLGCVDCLDAFSTQSPRSRKYALANDMWLDRPDPLLWQANLTHELRLGLAKMVATKVALRAGEPRSSSPTFYQSGYIGSSVVFHNGDARHAVEKLPPQQLNDALAASFCVNLPGEASVESCRAVVSQAASLQLHREQFLAQADKLRRTNPVYEMGVRQIDEEVLAK